MFKKTLAVEGGSASHYVPLLAPVGDGIFLLKDGSLARAYQLHGGDADTMTQIDKDRQSKQMCNALRLCDEKIMIWTTVQRRRTTHTYTAKYATPIQQYIYNQYTAQFMRIPVYENITTITFIYNANARAARFFDDVAFHINAGRPPPMAIMRAALGSISKKKTYQHYDNRLQAATMSFKNFLADMEGAMGGFLTPLTDIETMSFYHSLASPASPPQAINMPPPVAAIDAALADNTIRRSGNNFAPELLAFTGADKTVYGGSVALREWADLVSSGAFDHLLEIRADFTVTCVMSFMSTETAQKMFRGLEKKIMMSVRNLSDVFVKFANRDSVETSGAGQAKEHSIDQIHEAHARTINDRLSWAHCMVQIMAFGDTEEIVNSHITEISTAIRRGGHTIIRENLHLLPAWYSTMPGKWDGVKNWWPLTVEYFVDLLPMREMVGGDKVNHFLSESRDQHTPALSPFLTAHKSVYHLDLHTGSFGRKNGDNGHFFIVAPPGSGKTVLANWLIWSYQQYSPTRIIVLDKDLSCKIPILLQGGTYIETARGNQSIQMNPLSLLHDINQHGAFLSEWFTRLLAEEGVKISAKEMENALHELKISDPVNWRVENLGTLLSPDAANALQPWCNGNAYGDMDGEQDEFNTMFNANEYLIGIDMKRIFSDAKFGKACLDYLIYRIEMATEYENSTSGKIRPGMIYIEEAWNVLKLPRLAHQLDDWLRTLRKRSFCVGLATQSLREFKDGGLFEILNDSIPNRFFLGNPEAAAHQDLYAEFGLNAEDIEALRLMTVGDFLYCKNNYLKKRLTFQMPAGAIKALITNEATLSKFQNTEQYFNDEVMQ